MNSRYLEISSSYRNRFEYPNPSKFTVLLSQSGDQFSARRSYNPISESMPCYNFQGFENIKSSQFGGLDCPGHENQFGPGTPSSPNLGCYDSSGPFFTSNLMNYYNGATLQDNTISESSVIFLYNGIKKSCLLKNTFSDSWKSTDNWSLINTSIGGYQNFNDPKPMIITNGTPVESDHYKDYVLEDLSLDPIKFNSIEDRFKRIVKYDASSHHALIGRLSDGNRNIIGNINGSGFPIDTVSGWTKSDLYRIRISTPAVMGHGKYAVQGITSNINYNGNNGLSGTGPNMGNLGGVIKTVVFKQGKGFKGNVVLRQSSGEIISSHGSGLEIELTKVYNGKVCDVNVTVPGKNFTGGTLITLISPSGNENAVLKINNVGQTVDITNGLTNPTSGTLSIIHNFYKGYLLYVQSKGPEQNLHNVSNGGPAYYKQLPAKLKQNLSNTHYHNPPYSPDTTGSVVIDGYHVPSENVTYSDGTPVSKTSWISFVNGFADNISGGNPGKESSLSWEIQPFTRDSSSTLTYTGSTVSQNQMVCYQICLVKLILPNVTLRNGIGGKISFYPYIYVELRNETSPSGGQKNIIYSNNPNSTTATFLVPIDNMPSPIISKFIHVSGNGTRQTIKFKPNDNLSFRVFLSNGEDFVTIAPDNAPPELPNPYLQITALFDIQRLV
jgi:hypothetical protein